jgi:hypothetical protein
MTALFSHPDFRLRLSVTFGLLAFVIAGGCSERPPKKNAQSPPPKTSSVLDGLTSASITGIEIKLLPHKIDEKETRIINSQDRVAIDALIASLAPRTPVDPHKCATAGIISLQAPEKTVVVHILPGHNPEYYEVRNPDGAGNYRIPRGPFLTALEAMGVRDLPSLD